MQIIRQKLIENVGLAGIPGRPLAEWHRLLHIVIVVSCLFLEGSFKSLLLLLLLQAFQQAFAPVCWACLKCCFLMAISRVAGPRGWRWRAS